MRKLIAKLSEEERKYRVNELIKIQETVDSEVDYYGGAFPRTKQLFLDAAMWAVPILLDERTKAKK